MFWKKRLHPAPPPEPERRIDVRSMYLGRYAGGDTPGDELRYDGESHAVLFGPTGSGKTTRWLIPNLLNVVGKSIVALDMKGELCATTAAYRANVSNVVILNPFNALGLGSVGFNPLASLNPFADTFVDDAKGVAEALIKIEDKDPHWSESAEALITAIIMWEVILAERDCRPPLLENVRRMLTEADEFELVNGRRRQVAGFRITAARMCAEGGFEIESLIGKFLRDSDEIASVQSTAERQTSWILSRPMRRDLDGIGFDFRSLKREPTTVYVILPAERMRTHSVWLRLVVVTALRALYQAGGTPTLFMLDEFNALGHLAAIEDAFGLARGFGAQMMVVWQDLNQAKNRYERSWETFLANAGVVAGFAPRDLTTAEWMSRRCGDTTVVAKGYNHGDNLNSGGAGSSDGLSYQQVRRRLMLPHELMEIPKGRGLIWPEGTSKSVPFFAESYWKVPELAALARPNPYVLG